MTTTINPTLEDTLTPLANRLAGLAEKAEFIRLEMDAIKVRIRELVPGTDSYAAGPLTVVVSTNNRFDAAKALTLIPDVLRPIVVEQVDTVNKAKLKALAPELFELAQTRGDYRITLK